VRFATKRHLLIFAVLAAATAMTLLFTIVDPGGRADREAVDTDTERTVRAASARDGVSDVDTVGSTGDTSQAGPAGGAARNRRASQRMRLLYDDGEPATGVTIHCASGRKLVTKIFRMGDYPEKTIWMITHQNRTATDDDGYFSLRPMRGTTDAVLYTNPNSPAVLLAAWGGGQVEFRAARRATVTGTLRGSNGKVRKYEWLNGQLGRPEDYDTRNHRENDAFVAANGGLDIDPNCKCEAETGEDGRFTLLLAPGLNTLSIGESGRGGSVPIDVPTTGKLDLGDISPVPKSAASSSSQPRELHGTVRALSGAPLKGAEVRLWDGNVGQPSHEVHTDENGLWRANGLHAHRVIAWALSSSRHHMVLPQQSSGTIHMPCHTSVALVAPSEDEYAWVRTRDVHGFFLFVRDGVFLGGELLDSADVLGLPEGKYSIYAVTHSAVFELSTTIRPTASRTLTGFR